MLEPNINGIWVGKQTAKGTENTTPIKHPALMGGGFQFARDDGSSPYSDLSKYGAEFRYVNSAQGNGNPAIASTPSELAYILWLAHGAEVTASVTGPPAKTKHTFTPSLTQGFWHTWVTRLGLTQIIRQSWIDCLIGGFTIEGSTGQKDLRITPTVFSADPAKIVAADPSAALPTTYPFMYTEATGTFTIDTVVQVCHSQFQFTVSEDRSPYFGDDVLPCDFTVGTPTATIAATITFNANGQTEYNNLVYGTGSPTAGTKPLKTIAAVGSYSAWFKAKTPGTNTLNGNEFKLTIPAVQWAIPDAPQPNPAGGDSTIALSGRVVPPATGLPYTIDVNNDDVAYTI
ncbi:MAG: hypothetical protein H0W81_06545 [Chloroflexi bacterium]|nr:hypothetical protein [Chloroflexota bacterium]